MQPTFKFRMKVEADPEMVVALKALLNLFAPEEVSASKAWAQVRKVLVDDDGMVETQTDEQAVQRVAYVIAERDSLHEDKASLLESFGKLEAETQAAAKAMSIADGLAGGRLDTRILALKDKWDRERFRVGGGAASTIAVSDKRRLALDAIWRMIRGEGSDWTDPEEVVNEVANLIGERPAFDGDQRLHKVHNVGGVFVRISKPDDGKGRVYACDGCGHEFPLVQNRQGLEEAVKGHVCSKPCNDADCQRCSDPVCLRQQGCPLGKKPDDDPTATERQVVEPALDDEAPDWMRENLRAATRALVEQAEDVGPISPSPETKASTIEFFGGLRSVDEPDQTRPESGVAGSTDPSGTDPFQDAILAGQRREEARDVLEILEVGQRKILSCLLNGGPQTETRLLGLLGLLDDDAPVSITPILEPLFKLTLLKAVEGGTEPETLKLRPDRFDLTEFGREVARLLERRG